jgi:DNA-binding PadR family transcriptional regulator
MAVRDSLLGLLIDGPKHGYQLRIEHDAAAIGGKALNIGQVYTTLDRLQRDGLVTPTGGDDNEHDNGDGDGRRKHYALTEAGRAAAEAWFATATAADERPARDDLTTKVIVAIRAAGVDELAVIAVERHALIARLQAVRRARGDADLTRRLLIDAAAARLDAEVAWLDRCEAEIRAARRGRRSARTRGTNP